MKEDCIKSGYSTKEPVQKRSKETRRKILAAAKELFAEIGFERTTASLIAKQAGVSIGGLYARFNNKLEIFLTILKEYAEKTCIFFRENIDWLPEQEKDLAKAIDTLVRGLYYTHRLEGKLNFEIEKFIMMNEDAKKIYDHWQRREDEGIIRYLNYFFQEKVEDPESTAIVIHRATHGVFSYMYQNKDSIDEELLF